MNVKSVKQNLVLLISVFLFVVALAWTFWLGHRAAARNQEAERELQTRSGQLRLLLQGNPSPTHENINVLSQDREQLEQLYPSILHAASRGNIQTPALRRPVEFQELLAKKVKRLRQTAAEVGVEIPEGFAFGFGRYVSGLPCQGVTGEECERILAQLAKQLLVVERLCDILLGQKIEKLEQIRRMDVEAGPSGDTLRIQPPKESSVVYETVPFEFRFYCSTEKLRSFLNSLSQSDWFFAVRSLNAERDKSEAGGGASLPGILAVTMQIDLLEFPGVASKTEK